MSRRPRPKATADRRVATVPARHRWRLGAALMVLAAALAGAWLWLTATPSRPPSGPEALARARAALSHDRAALAERWIDAAILADPTDPEPWRLRLEILRARDCPEDAWVIGQRAFASIDPARRGAVLSAWTLALLAEAPDDQVRNVLARWVDADPDDFRSRAAWLRRIGNDPRDGDPDSPTRIRMLTELLEAHPDEPLARTALIEALFDAGRGAEAKSLLDDWPADRRDARYHRLLGRWAQDVRRDAALARPSLAEAARLAPADLRPAIRLARVARAIGDAEAARAWTIRAQRLREHLDPATLAPRLERALARPTDPAPALDLAELADRLGLPPLASAWRIEAKRREARP